MLRRVAVGRHVASGAVVAGEVGLRHAVQVGGR
jgi:hypothetical protein